MKKELIISSVIAIVLIIVVLVNSRQPATSSTGTKNTLATSIPVSTAASGITTSEVAKHSTATDCWIIIKGNVYDVTSYLSAHPGGSGEVIKTCGADATVAFNAIERGRGHSTTAEQILPTLHIGTVQ